MALSVYNISEQFLRDAIEVICSPLAYIIHLFLKSSTVPEDCFPIRFYAFQSFFRADHSTDTALTFLADILRFNMDDGLYTGMILIDLQKAFDTVDYSMLATQLKAIGADRPSESWFESYLSGRKQLINVNWMFS